MEGEVGEAAQIETRFLRRDVEVGNALHDDVSVGRFDESRAGQDGPSAVELAEEAGSDVERASQQGQQEQDDRHQQTVGDAEEDV